MYLKQMELQGFKSFPDKTVLNFERGVTVVVGPNGSGKSNISDAMRWVLGEISSKNIRGTKMEDVIFAGAANRPPMGYAEVSVTFDNTPERGRVDCPYDEITVTRRYYRAGDSEYFINRKPVRLKDIHELFMSTGIGREGYSIIGQGRISEILSRKSEDRRTIFEEAAGISKYRYKKQEAERSLASAEDNIVRINDIFGELESRIGPLEKDAEKAKKYLEYYEIKKQADVSLWIYDTAKTREDLTVAEENYRLSESELSMANEALERLETETDRIFDESQKNKLRSEQLWNEIKRKNDDIHSFESDFKIAENDIEHCEEKIEELKRAELLQNEQIDSLKSELEKGRNDSAELSRRLSEIDCRRAEIGSEKSETENEINKKTEELELQLKEIKRLENEKTDLRVRLSVIENSRTTDSEKDTDITAEIEKYKEISGKLTLERADAQKTVDDYTERLATISDKLSEARKSGESLTEELQNKQSEKGKLEVIINSLDQKIENLRRMEEHFEGYNNAVRFVMKASERNEINGRVYGPISKLISTEKDYTVAVETALGSAIQNIVVEDENTAKNAIYALKNASAGRATFYPLTSVKSSEPTVEMRKAENYRGFIGFADTLLHYDGKFESVIRSLLGRTVVFDNIENASAMAKALHYSVKAVTLDGQQINVGGSFTGGSAKRDSGILTRSAEISRLISDRENAEKEHSALEKSVKEIEASIAKSRNEYNSLFENKSVLESLLSVEKSSLDSVIAKLSANEELLGSIEGDYKRLSEQKEQYEKDYVTLTERISSVEDEYNRITEERTAVESDRGELYDKSDILDEELSGLMIAEVQLKTEAEAKKTAESGLVERIAFHESQIESIALETRANVDKIKAKKDYIGQSQYRRKEAEDILAALDAEREQVDADALLYEQKLNELRAATKEKNGQKEILFRSFTKHEAKLAQLRSECDKLAGKLWDDYELTNSTALELGYPAVTAENRHETVQKQNEYKNKLRALGSVNVGAIEEYAEVRERYDSMKRQLDDLSSTKKDLEAIISDLETEMKGTFVEAFNKINTNFNEVFGQLFGGGNAEIVLTEPENVLTSGIEIKAAPPGKIIKSLSLLSGGEQAFVAIALFFAILKYSPTPFSILDEIEAALDEVNVDRFAEYVKKYSLETQFVLITHRRGTMEVGDRLYGVTMPQKGISKVLTMSVGEIEKFKKEMLA